MGAALTLLSCLLFVSFTTFHASAEDGKGVEAVLIMDSSGSMKKTDPANLRKAAARLFISLLRDNDRAGLVSFSDEGQKLSDLTEVADKQNRMQLIKSLEKITSSGKYTNIYDGLQKGYEILKASANKERLLILMSDGQMDLGDKAREDSLTKEMQAVLLPELKKAGVRIYTIAFTEFSDRALLEDLALKTGGSFKVAQTDKDLHLVFTSMFERIKSPEALPIKDNAFQVDKDIHEFTLLITKKTPKIRIAIKDPAGKEHKAGRKAASMEWFESGAFDMVTVKDPAPGLWNIKFSAEEGNKVFIITDMKLLSSFSKTTVEQGKPIKFEAWLTKDNEPLKTKEILERVKISVNIKTPEGTDVAAPLHDDGTNNDSTAGDGVYTLGLPVEQPGEYNLTLTAEGETFRREKVFVFKATAPVAVVVKTIVDEKTEIKKEWISLYTAGLIITAFAVAVILLTILSLYLYFLGRRYKKTAALAGKKGMVSSGILEKYIGEKLNEITQQSEEAGEGGSPVAQAHEELSALSLQFLQNSLEGVRKGGEDQVKGWDGIFSGFEELAKGVVTKGSELQSEARALDEKLKGIDLLKDDNKRLKEVIDKQNAKITELMGYRDLLAESQQRLAAIQKGNEELMTKIGELADKAEGFEELKYLKAILERNNKELDTSLSILEEENIRLTGDFEKWQEEIKQIEKEREHEKVMEESEFNRLAREREGMEDKLKELKDNLAVRDKALISLQQNYEALEKEYLALYKEHQQ